MLIYAAGSVAARIAVALCVVVMGLPFLLRRGRLNRGLGLGPGDAIPYRQRLRPHFWTAYFAAGLTIVHVGTVMPARRRANVAGVWFAAGALLLLIFEMVAGLSLRESGWKERAVLRRIHFWIALCFACLLTLHLWLNA